MYTTKSLMRGIVTISLVAVLSGYAIAAEPTMGDQPMAEQQTEQRTFSPTANLSIRKATELIGEPVKNTQGQTLGTIYDLVLTPDLDRISYVALSRGGLFGIGRILHAIPWSAMRLGAGGSYILPISEEELTQWRGFSPSAWPTEAHRGWVSGEVPADETPQTAAESQSAQDRRYSRIRGITVETPEGLDAGNIDNLVVAMDDGRILYTIVSFGSFLGLGEQYAAVPHQAIDLESGRRVAKVNVGRDVLRENAFAAGQFPDLGNPSYARSINQAYGVETGDTVLGFVPAEEPEAARPETDKKPGAFRIDPLAPFDPAAIKTVEGVVTMVGKYARTEATPDILILQIREDNGNLHLVHAGPLNYVSKQDFYAVNGDRVSVTGVPIRGESPFFLAARISRDGQVLTLRDREGKPLWERSPETGQRPDATTHTPEHHMEGAPRG